MLAVLSRKAGGADCGIPSGSRLVDFKTTPTVNGKAVLLEGTAGILPRKFSSSYPAHTNINLAAGYNRLPALDLTVPALPALPQGQIWAFDLAGIVVVSAPASGNMFCRVLCEGGSTGLSPIQGSGYVQAASSFAGVVFNGMGGTAFSPTAPQKYYLELHTDQAGSGAYIIRLQTSLYMVFYPSLA